MQSDAISEWYQLWMQQSKNFFTSVEGSLDDLPNFNPKENIQQINAWLETLKTQWQYHNMSSEQQFSHTYFQLLEKMYNHSIERFLAEWIKRYEDNNPIQNTRDLYEMWLSCCQEEFQRMLATPSYQKAYAMFLNAGLKVWQDTLKKMQP